MLVKRTLLAASFLLAGCGARTGLHVEKDGGPYLAPECMTTADCEPEDACHPVACDYGSCVPLDPIDCDDGDPCTKDECAPESGACTHDPTTFDLDKDGHRAPLPGKKPGEPGACGDDCDDANAKAFPGNAETCDGVDNDCNGIVDDGMHYVPASGGPDAVQVSSEMPPAGPGGLAWSGESYMAVYTGQVKGKDGVYDARLDLGGAKIGAEAAFNDFPADAMGGPVVWTGDRYGIAWQDRRNGNYEVYFNEMGPDGAKLGPDVRVTNAGGFSINVAMTWTGSEFVLVWEDDRVKNNAAGVFHVYGQTVDLDRNLVGENVKLSLGQLEDHESPQIATGLSSVGVVWTHGDPSKHGIAFQTFGFDLKPKMDKAIELVPDGLSGVFPTIVWSKLTEQYLVAYYDPDHTPRAIYATALGEDGKVAIPPKKVTDSPRHSRYPALLPLGDRTLLVWSDDKDQSGGYELYSKMLGNLLDDMGAESRVTSAKGDSVFPIATFGPQGNVGVLFRDDRDGTQEVWFSHLVCEAGSSP